MTDTNQSQAAVGISHSINFITTILASVSATSFYLKGEDIIGTDLLSRDAHKRLDKIKSKLREADAHQLVTSGLSEDNTTIFIEKEVRAHMKKYTESIRARGGRNQPKATTAYKKPRVYIDQAIDYLEVEMRRYGFTHRSAKAQSGPQWIWNASYCQYCYWWEQEGLWVFEDGKQVPPGDNGESAPGQSKQATVKDKVGKGADGDAR